MGFKHLLLIDAGGFAMRAYSMAPKRLDKDGREIGAVDGFATSLNKILREMAKDQYPVHHAAILFDGPREKNWRREIYPAYKANRPDHEPDYLTQLEDMRDICRRIGLAEACVETHEADDLIAALTLDARDKGMAVSILAADKDIMSLVRKGVRQSPHVDKPWMSAADVREKIGVIPEMVLDWLALAGDVGDGVPGAPGIGGKIAADLLNAHGGLDRLLAEPDLAPRPSSKKALREFADQIRMSRQLVTLDTRPEILPFRPEDLTFPDHEEALRVMRSYLLERVGEAGLQPENDHL